MIIVCCMCKKKLGEKEPLKSKIITHTYCEECKKIVEKEIEEYKPRIGLVAELMATTKIDIME